MNLIHYCIGNSEKLSATENMYDIGKTDGALENPVLKICLEQRVIQSNYI